MLVVTLQNISQMSEVSDYHFEVWVTTASGGKKLIEVGDVLQHKRSDGWKVLVQRLLNEVEE